MNRALIGVDKQSLSIAVKSRKSLAGGPHLAKRWMLAKHGVQTKPLLRLASGTSGFQPQGFHKPEKASREVALVDQLHAVGHIQADQALAALFSLLFGDVTLANR